MGYAAGCLSCRPPLRWYEYGRGRIRTYTCPPLRRMPLPVGLRGREWNTAVRAPCISSRSASLGTPASGTRSLLRSRRCRKSASPAKRRVLTSTEIRRCVKGGFDRCRIPGDAASSGSSAKRLGAWHIAQRNRRVRTGADGANQRARRTNRMRRNENAVPFSCFPLPCSPSQRPIASSERRMRRLVYAAYSIECSVFSRRLEETSLEQIVDRDILLTMRVLSNRNSLASMAPRIHSVLTNRALEVAPRHNRA